MTFNSIDQHRHDTTHDIKGILFPKKKISKNSMAVIVDDKKLDVLFYLKNMRTLTATHIKILAYANNSMSTVYASLMTLHSKGLIDYHSYSKGRGIGNLDRLYFLTKKGYEYIDKLQFNSSGKIPRYQEPFTNSYYDHRRKLLDFWVAIIMESRKFSSLYHLAQFIPEWDKFENESIVMRYESVNEEMFTIKPDATFILRNLATNQEVLFFVEIDTGSESVMSRDYPCIHQRIFRYNQAFRFGVFKKIDPYFKRFTGARLLFVTSSYKRINNILAKLKTEESLNDAFLFSTHADIWKKGVINGKFRKIGFSGEVGINSREVLK
jgi:DNA-binding PadR family transcriptional regulator